MTVMKRYVVALMVLTGLVIPLMAWADDQSIPPEANWTPTPPYRSTVDAAQLTEILVRKGVLTPIDHRGLMQSSVVPAREYPREMDRQDGRDYVISSE
jgi:hypothetical protein